MVDRPVSIPEGWSRHSILMLLTSVYVINYVDRQILGILLPQIKAEFFLTDFQLGILSGLAFAVIYALMGIPIGVLADRTHRRNVIAGALTLFSAATIACGLALTFTQLLVARFFAGVGEAGTGPAINSLVSDLYRPHERARALSFYACGLNLGLLIAYFGGGWIAQHYGWRVAIMVAGVPGLILTILLFLFVPEPRRGQTERGGRKVDVSKFLATARYLLTQRSFCRLTFGSAMMTFNGSVVLAFMPAFLSRSHHMTLTNIGLSLALMAGVGGVIGTYSAGIFASHLGRRDIRWNMHVISILNLLQLPLLPLLYLSGNTYLALAALILPLSLLADYSGVTLATIANLVPVNMRAIAPAIHGAITGLFGVALGPMAAGFVSDALHPTLGQDSLRWSMLILSFSSMVIASLGYWWASWGLAEDVEKNQRA